MTYKYFLSGSPINTYPPSTGWKNGFDSFLDADFYNSPNTYTIQEETVFGSGSLVDVDARITTAISNDTGMKLSDDFKQLLFKSDHIIGLGYKYYFDSNYWIVTNVNVTKSITVTALARRCNNVLRWTDQNGIIYEEPCVIDYKIASPNNNTTDPITGEGTIHIFAQQNNKTNKIKENQRFLFGNSNNWMCYRVYGGGIKNYLNNTSIDNDTSTVMELVLGKNSVNEDTDDLVNGIADANKIVFSLVTSPSAIYGGIGDSFKLESVVTLNELIVSKDVLYSTSSSSVASVSGSGVVNILSTGSCVITSYLENNSSVYDTVSVVSSSAIIESDIRITPSDRYILEGDTQNYNVGLYQNGILQVDTFSISLYDKNVPGSNYTLTQTDGNNFSIKNNEMFLDYPLILTLTSSGSVTKNLSIELKGAW